MKVRIGIVTCNRREVLEKAIQSALSQSYADKEIVVADDASTDDTGSLAAKYPQVQWITNTERKGCIRARHELMMMPGADAYCSLDDDSWFLEDEGLAKAVKRLESDSTIGAIAFTIQDAASQETGTDGDVAWFIGCGHLVHLDPVRLTGGYGAFPGDYGCEEKDLSIRLIDQGYRIERMADIAVWHDKTFEARDVPRLHASGVCNDLAFDFLRCPLPLLFFYLPKKVISHLIFALKYALKKSGSLSSWDTTVRNTWGRAVFFRPYFTGISMFLKESKCIWALRSPVSPAAYRTFRAKASHS
ncbi:MAG: GT2 family glycosyltransferase [Verrucomicrobiales bacterium]|jgi:GT2 family glycosyltransferase